MNIYLGIKTKVLKDTLSIELKEKDIDVICLEPGDSIPKNSTIVLEVDYIKEVNLPPQDDLSNIVIIGYKEELNSYKLKNYHKNLERPFRMEDFFALIFEDISYTSQPLSVRKIDKLIFDNDKRIIYLDNKSVKLPKRLYALFMYLYSNYNKICSREEIFKEVWGDEIEDIYCVDTYICYLKTKLSSTLSYPIIKNIRNKGYIMT